MGPIVFAGNVLAWNVYAYYNAQTLSGKEFEGKVHIDHVFMPLPEMEEKLKRVFVSPDGEKAKDFHIIDII
jgi:hypothetical protein